MRLILLEPQLKGFSHHYLTYAIGIVDAARRLGIETQILVDRRIDAQALHYLMERDIEVIPTFFTGIAVYVKSRAVAWPLRACEYALALHKISPQNRTDQLILTASGNIEYLTGAAPFLLRSPKGMRLVVQMFQWATRERISRTPRIIRHYRHITESLVAKALDSGRLMLAGQGEGIAAYLSTLFRRPIPTLPFVIDWSGFSLRRVREGALLRIGFLGVMRTEKGLKQLVDAMERSSSNAEFVVQAVVPETLAEPQARDLITRLRKIGNCTVVEGELSIESYRHLLNCVDIIVLPYRPADFRYKTSNIFAEAVGLAKVVVTPKETLMGRIADGWGIGVTYSPYTCEALSEALKEATVRFDQLRARSQAVALIWRREHSAEEFVRRVMEIAYPRDEESHWEAALSPEPKETK